MAIQPVSATEGGGLLVSQGSLSRGEGPSDDGQWHVQAFESFPFSSSLLFFSDLNIVSFVFPFR